MGQIQFCPPALLGIHRNPKQKDFSILVLALGQILRHILDKVTEWHFHSTSNEVIWLKKIKLQSGVKKCYFGNFLEMAGMAMPG